MQIYPGQPILSQRHIWVSQVSVQGQKSCLSQGAPSQDNRETRKRKQAESSEEYRMNRKLMEGLEIKVASQFKLNGWAVIRGK